MSSEPYTPSLEIVNDAWTFMRNKRSGIDLWETDAEFDRFIAKVKADALRGAADALPKPVGLNCNKECHDVDWASLRVRADRIEGEA